MSTLDDYSFIIGRYSDGVMASLINRDRGVKLLRRDGKFCFLCLMWCEASLEEIEQATLKSMQLLNKEVKANATCLYSSTYGYKKTIKIK